MPVEKRPCWVAMQEQQYRSFSFINKMNDVAINFQGLACKKKELSVEPIGIKIPGLHGTFFKVCKTYGPRFDLIFKESLSSEKQKGLHSSGAGPLFYILLLMAKSLVA